MGAITVSQLNAYLSSVLKGDKNLKGIIVRGEISNFVNYRKSGHCYFTLKEGNCAVKAVMFSRYAIGLKFVPTDGMDVFATADVEVYDRDGVFELIVCDMFPVGLGSLYLEVNALREKLFAEGIFNEEHKKPIPKIPLKVGVVTSKEGAAFHDIVNVISRRFPVVTLLLFPCLVQGKDAPDSISAAIDYADISSVDVIICGRGGGSYEDLMAFNSESVVRAVYECKTPVISAVGHETDTTLIDYVSDKRAPTPSAAAEIAVPLLEDIFDSLYYLKNDLNESIGDFFDRNEIRLDNMEKSLEILSPKNKLKLYEERLKYLNKNLYDRMNLKISDEEKKLTMLCSQLDTLSPVKTMMRGYSIVSKDNIAVKSALQVMSGDEINIDFYDGKVKAVVK